MCVDCKKCDREKPTKGGRAEDEINTPEINRDRQCKPRFDKLSEQANKGWGFIFAWGLKTAKEGTARS